MSSALFTEHRPLLFGIAYRMLGRVVEAEDAVQETFLRWQKQNPAAVQTPKAWLIATLTRLCIDQLRSVQRQREDYVGIWLPEPFLNDDHTPSAPSPADTAALGDSLGMAFMLLLEKLTPLDRAVFLLREAFDRDYSEIASIVGKSEAACRQIVSRARTQLALTPRPSDAVADVARTEPLVARFTEACRTGNLNELLALLTEDAVLYTDGGGKVKSRLKPIVSALYASRFLAGISPHVFREAISRPTVVNGHPGMIQRRPNGVLTVNAFAFDATGTHIRAIYIVSNPEKLTHAPALPPVPGPSPS